MTLRVTKYDPGSNAIVILTGDPHDETDDVDYCNGHILDYDSATYKPTSFELVLCARGYLDLSADRGYDNDTDTLTFGDGIARSEFEVANGDLVAHWGYPLPEDDPHPEFYVPVAIQLRNASVHLASTIASFLKNAENTQ